MRILHVSADYPDPLDPAKTKAVRNLLSLADEHEHRVWSLNRVDQGSAIRAMPFGDVAGARHKAVAYGAPPKGVLLATRLRALAQWILTDAAADGFAPDAIHVHKLSMEGLIGRDLARALGKPLIVSVQGNTDAKIVGFRVDLRSAYRAIWREAAVAFPFAPWAARRLDALLGARTGPTTPLPCPGEGDQIIAPSVVGPVFRTAFHFRDAKNKNAAALIAAVGRAAASVPEIRLEIVGGGDAAAYARLVDVAEAEARGRVRFLGGLPHAEMQPLFNQSCGFALLSHRESFGMVFSEALLAGCPCLFPRGRAIDGYLEEGGVVLAADPNDVAEITRGLVALATQEAAFKERLGTLAEAGGLDFLRRDAIVERYREGLRRAAA